MRQVIEQYVCDICGRSIQKTPFDFLEGKSVKIRDGIIARPVEMDLCDDCFQNMKKYCISKREGGAQ